jgi:hypothetical protein
VMPRPWPKPGFPIQLRVRFRVATGGACEWS